jgi:hypothetical protein
MTGMHTVGIDSIMGLAQEPLKVKVYSSVAAYLEILSPDN